LSLSQSLSHDSGRDELSRLKQYLGGLDLICPFSLPIIMYNEFLKVNFAGSALQRKGAYPGQIDQDCHRPRNGQGRIFTKVTEKSGDFVCDFN